LNEKRRFSFTIDGAPKVQKRSRMGRGGHWYAPSSSDQKIIGKIAYEARLRAKMPILEGPVLLKVDFYGLRSNADLSNAIKLVEDGCNGVAWIDDRQVSVLMVFRRASSGKARTEVSIEEL
jgi:Holliday junction resolvase RusA-like endonuclease